MGNPKEISHDDWVRIAKSLVGIDADFDLFDWNYYYISGADVLKAVQHYRMARAFANKVYKKHSDSSVGRAHP